MTHIRRVLSASPFHGEGYRKAWAKLRVEGTRTSKERVRRLMREHDLQAPHRVGHAHGPKAHDGTITTEAPDLMWGTDMTATVTVGEGTACVFVAVDHCTTECIGLHAAKRGNRFEALEPIRQGVREHFGGLGEGVARGLRLRHDHGSNYLADDFQQEIAFFGMESSPSFVREPEGNGVAERFIRTLKENLLWGAELRDDRATPPGVTRVQADVQRAVDAGEVRLSQSRPGTTRPRRAGRGSVDTITVKITVQESRGDTASGAWSRLLWHKTYPSAPCLQETLLPPTDINDIVAAVNQGGWDSSNGGMVVFQTAAVGVGIGTTSPGARLDVNGGPSH